MKFIPLRDDSDFKSRDIIDAVVTRPTAAQGINVEEMRRRCRLLDAMEKATGDTLQIEDADHAFLVQLVNGFQFGIAHPKLMQIIDDIVDAKEPVSAVKAVV